MVEGQGQNAHFVNEETKLQGVKPLTFLWREALSCKMGQNALPHCLVYRQ